MTAQPNARAGVGGAGVKRVDVLLVTSEACHLCEMAQDLIKHLSSEYPIRLRTLDMVEEEGARLTRQYRVPFPPVLFVAGVLHGYGRVSERKLRRRLDDLVSGN